MTCSECNGTGYREDDTEARVCDQCDGTGRVCWLCGVRGADCDCRGDDEV
jgi:hypothetical protein